jgi:tight adherence protein C
MMSAFASLGLGSGDVIALAAGAGAFVTLGLIYSALLVRDPMSARAKALTARRDELRAGALNPGRNRNRPRKADAVGAMRRVVDRLNLMRGEHVAKMTRRLSAAGWRSKDALVVYLFFKLTMPFALGGLVMMWAYGMGLGQFPLAVQMLAGLSAVIAGAYLPDLAVTNQATKRKAALQKGLPDGLDLLVICAEAGLALDAALNRVAKESAQAAPELSEEFSLTALELGFVPERRTALENLAARTDLPALRGVVNTLLQAEKYGTPLAQSLRVLSAEYRNDRMMKAEEKAAKLPATLTVPLIVFILPSLFVVLLGPAILKAIDGLGGL